MRKVVNLMGIGAMICGVFMVVSCVTHHENPNVGPVLAVEIPELFSPDPDVENDKMTVGITVSHPVPIRDWTIEIQPNRRGGGQAGQSNEQRQARQDGERAQRQEGEGGEQRQRPRRAPFFEQAGKGKPPTAWQWDGKSTRESAEMVQSATAYRFVLTVNDVFENTTSYEGVIEVDVLVRREGSDLRMIVPSIVFPGNSADLASSAISEEDQRANRRVLGLIARALTKYEDYAITVEGHANPLTPPDTPERAAEEKSDQLLSEQRAQSVVNYLGSEGNISRSRLASVGMSCTRPVADYDDEDENWKNRRVEFLLKKN